MQTNEITTVALPVLFTGELMKNNYLWSYFCIIYTVLFGYNTVVWLTVFAMDPSNNVTKKLWCICQLTEPQNIPLANASLYDNFRTCPME